MENNPSFPKRKSPRAPWLTYNEGDYFVTVCTNEMKYHFGKIVDGKMYFTPIGEFLYKELENVEIHHPHVEILIYTVMPNHFHAIVRINTPCKTDAIHRVPTGKPRALTGDERMQNKVGERHETSNPLLSTFIGQLKSSITRYAHQKGIAFKWQSRYHDHVIRNTCDGNNISRYIENNVANWTKDCFYNPSM